MALDQRAREIPMKGDQLAAILLELGLGRAARAQRLTHEDELGDAADQILDGEALGMEASGSRMPQRSGHVLSVIGLNQEMVKRGKKFSKLSLS